MIEKTYVPVRVSRRENRWFYRRRVTRFILDGFPEKEPTQIDNNIFNNYLDILTSRRWARYHYTTGAEDMASFMFR